MALLFFSGGIDSTVLAFDMAQSPHRYGLVEGEEDLVLFTFGGRAKVRGLKPLVDEIRQVSKLEVGWAARECPLVPDEHLKMPPGGMKSTVPSVGRYQLDRRRMPFTPGLMLWLSSFAINELSESDYQRAFFGFQWEAPEWAEYDTGTHPPNDTSPKFIAALNKVAREASSSVVFRAPFLEGRLDRYQVVRLGVEIGAPLQRTHSCIVDSPGECGRCCQCIKRNTAFLSAGVK